MSDEELDPEVLADLQLRESSTRDRTRTAREPRWIRPVLVESWPCRAPRCGNSVEVTEEVVDGLKICNRELVRRGEREIPTDAIVLCDSCKLILEHYRLERRLERNKRIAENVRLLKGSANPRMEHEAIRQLQTDHHPDIAGLLDVLERRLNAERASKRSRKGDL